MFNFILIISLLFAAYAEEASPKQISVFVAPIKVMNSTSSVQATISDYSVIGYASMHYTNAKAKVGGRIIPITEVYDKVLFYDNKTLPKQINDCNFKREALSCAAEKGLYTLIPIIEVTEYQLIVRLILYDTNSQIISQSTRVSNKIIRYIRQQEVTVVEQQSPFGGNSTVTHYGKEEQPLKWEIPHRLLDKHMYQASLGLWVGRII